jgi:hypothetical protein
MQRGLFFTTMKNHRPVYISAPQEKTETSETKPKTDTNSTNREVPRLRVNLTRSTTQPVFSVSAMFGVRSGGGCGSCGH